MYFSQILSFAIIFASASEGRVEQSLNVRLDNDVPYLRITRSKWMPICGHYFWDNNIGADIVCQNLGYSQGGVLELERGPYNEDAYFVGRCDSKDITDLKNGCKKEPLGPPHSCKKGNHASVKIQCKGRKEYCKCINPFEGLTSLLNIGDPMKTCYKEIIPSLSYCYVPCNIDCRDTKPAQGGGRCWSVHACHTVIPVG